MEELKRAENLVSGMKEVVMATYRADGFPNLRSISAIKSEGLKKVWLITGNESDKVAELRANPRCALYANDYDCVKETEDFIEIRLWGRVDVKEDRATKELFWDDCYATFFPGGSDDPALCVLEFTASEGVIADMTSSRKLDL